MKILMVENNVSFLKEIQLHVFQTYENICAYFLPPSPALTGFLLDPLFTYCLSFSALSRYWTHLALMLSLALSLWASSKIYSTLSHKNVQFYLISLAIIWFSEYHGYVMAPKMII